jgi:flagellar hook-associated protein 2
MAGIQASGIGSGLDINGIVTQLMALERQPIEAIERKERIINTQISAYGQLKSKVSEFEDAMAALGSADKFRIYAANSTDEEVLGVTASSSAAKGIFSIDVKRIAENHKLASAAQADADTTQVASASPMTIQVGDNSFDVDVNGKTLQEIRDEINKATDNKGVTASVLHDDEGYRLLLTSDETGSDHFIQLTNDPYSMTTINEDRDENSTFEAADLDAVLVFENNFTVTRSSNSISDIVDGITLDIKKPGEVVIDINRDDEAIKESVQTFADAYNALKDEINTQRSGALEADSTLSSIESRMLNVLNSGNSITDSSYQFLSEVGLAVDKEGQMQLDGDLFTKQMNADFSSVVNLFSIEGEGFANRLESVAKSILESKGLIEGREDGFKVRLDRFEDRKIQLEARMENTERRLRKQFGAMDAFVAQMNSTGSFLTQQLASLSNIGRQN